MSTCSQFVVGAAGGREGKGEKDEGTKYQISNQIQIQIKFKSN